MPSLPAPPLSLYVHFPWCVRKCPYCDFNSHTLQGELPRRPTSQRLPRDLDAQAADVAGARRSSSVFLGGGTPSLFSPRGDRALLGGRAPPAARSRPMPRSRSRRTRHDRARPLRRISGRRHQPRVARRAELRRPRRWRRSAASTRGARRAARPGSCTPPASPTSISTSCTRCPGQDRAGAVRDIEAALALAPAASVALPAHARARARVFAARPPALPDEDEAAAAARGVPARCSRRRASATTRCRPTRAPERSAGTTSTIGTSATTSASAPARTASSRFPGAREHRAHRAAARAAPLSRAPRPASCTRRVVSAERAAVRVHAERAAPHGGLLAGRLRRAHRALGSSDRGAARSDSLAARPARARRGRLAAERARRLRFLNDAARGFPARKPGVVPVVPRCQSGAPPAPVTGPRGLYAQAGRAPSDK